MKVLQESDTLPRAVLLTVTVGVVVVTLLGVGAAALLQRDKHEDLGGHPYTGDAELHPPAEVNAMEMTLFDDRAGSLPTLRLEAGALETWGWADASAELVRIPLSRAMDLYLEGWRPRREGGAP